MTDFDEKVWRKDVEHMRREKSQWMLSSPDSPVPHEVRHHIKEIEHFPPDPSFRFEVRLISYPDPEKLVLATSRGQKREYLRIGFFEFIVDGTKQKLHAYVAPTLGHAHDEAESLFVPFRDATSGKESYGAARYIDLEFSPSGKYVLDFNLAYNPYCAYSDEYVCPFPPPENWLKVPIRAGEKSFHRTER